MHGLPKVYVFDIPEKRLQTVRKHFTIPANETIFLISDHTFFGSNKEGFACTSWGIRWKNMNEVPSPRIAISWEEVRKTPFYVKDYTLQFGNDAILNIPGLRVPKWRECFLAMLMQMGAIPGF